MQPVELYEFYDEETKELFGYELFLVGRDLCVSYILNEARDLRGNFGIHVYVGIPSGTSTYQKFKCKTEIKMEHADLIKSIFLSQLDIQDKKRDFADVFKTLLSSQLNQNKPQGILDMFRGLISNK